MSFEELEHLKIKTRLLDEMFVNVMGEYVFFKISYVYYESLKRDLQRICIDGCRYNERLNTKSHKFLDGKADLLTDLM